VRDDAPITADAAPARPRTRRTPSTRRQGFFERRVFGPLVAWLLGVRQTAARAREQADDATAVARRFAVLWWPLMRPALHRTLRYTLHLGAIGLAAGAVCGMYVRGLFLAYDVVWQSTFLKDPEVVATCLRALLGPAALVLGSEVPDSAAEMDALMGEGAPAAPWIHLYAMSAVLFIVLPRTLLAMAARHRLRRTERFFRLDLSEEYYADLLRRAHAVAPQELRAGIQQVARDECRKVAAGLADLVTSRLYDERIVPRLRRFRETGGTLRALEAELAQECRAFGPVLEREMLHLQRDLEGRLVARVRRLLGDDHGLAARVPGDLVDRVTVASSRAATHVGERVSGDVAAAVGGVVSGAVGLAVGTISGGFGEALGIALLVGVVETGPVGWLVGAVGGIVVAGVALVAGRERLRQGVKVVPLPAAALKVALWSGRYERLVEEGRRKCRQSVADALAGQLDELAARIADHVWRGLRPLIGELQRPRVGDDLQRPSADRDDGGS
ncbi:MAG TPA: DUF2868 domain-containing protein, partial [Candidatus Tectomicrobia bacterium]|nr:DUF2868 domain-containing protein [Candidatus Tectomicrobia bacterium]